MERAKQGELLPLMSVVSSLVYWLDVYVSGGFEMTDVDDLPHTCLS